ncbi:1-deoxy-D-xylulose-5-phosphate synthase [Thermanaerovibrio velox DSM 12556]|uniref:1-deoxy-D-xylulose-5-phosphate synthase n=1 Tax=Thermanaerovibrio velox DSM 12556 TaxID=926567 RepID=H0URU1_9BACT|nr:1-deoxy-D-xylulose-5-phosphate synthase [Thermanaerovibrio velox DSM 12556]
MSLHGSMSQDTGGVLWNLKGPQEIKNLSKSQVGILCKEVRDLICQVTLSNGGHLASSLGAVELIVSLLRSFSPPEDKIIFDVGHQAYAYKILTDRRDVFKTLRQKDGIAGFPRRKESPYDAFDVGHSSTSISAALGMAKARESLGEKGHVVAVIGDGALINGLAFEGLNNVTPLGTKVIIILNDNKMSINHRVGGMAEHLAKLSASSTYQDIKQRVKKALREAQGGQKLEDLIGRWKGKIKSLLLPPNIFEEMDITYWGPFDGHDVDEMDRVFTWAKEYPESVLIHVITKKGKGYQRAEVSPTVFHGVSPSFVGREDKTEDGTLNVKTQDWSSLAASIAEEMAAKDPRVVCSTAAMKEGSKLGKFANSFPDRFFDVGIAESHLITFAAGMAAEGMIPLVFIYSTFLQRAMDQLVHDVCLPGLPVLLCVDRAGLVGEDGETHQGLLDVSWGKCIPNLTLMSPRDGEDLRFMMSEWLKSPGPALIRYPKGAVKTAKRMVAPWGRLEVIRNGRDICLAGYGSTVSTIEAAADILGSRGMDPTVLDLRFLKPLDHQGMIDVLSRHRLVVVAEEGYRLGGMGETICRLSSERGLRCRVITMGVSDRFVPHAKRQEQLEEEGLTPHGVVQMLDEISKD